MHQDVSASARSCQTDRRPGKRQGEVSFYAAIYIWMSAPHMRNKRVDFRGDSQVILAMQAMNYVSDVQIIVRRIHPSLLQAKAL